jgi:short chain dehydrogenase
VPFEQIPVEEWDRLMAMNLRGIFLCCRAVVPAMKRQQSGKIVNEGVAELRPAHRHGPAGLSIEERLQALAEAGELTCPSLSKGDWTWKVKGLGLPPGTAARLLDEVRGDRL